MTGQITVTTAGTRVQASAQPCVSVLIKAMPSNTGVMYVGGATVSGATGFPLSAGDVILMEVLNLSDIWLDASVSGEKVAYLQLKER